MIYSVNAMAADATLSWNPSTDPTVAGYKVHYGMSSGIYGHSIKVGNRTTYTVTGLGNGTYYFTVTAYDSSGNQSAFSNEVSKTFTGVQSTDATGSSGNVSGGCGMIKPQNGKPQGPGQAADMVGFMVMILIVILKKEFNRKKIFEIPKWISIKESIYELE